ncbi:hypothetical protein ABZX75_26515 [Streptomyces sp. NPDC003038]|uniref:hypothetical protein n=1 Tax=unclassified Streptomyces TaxID=2593676 RepID=UPI0033AF4E05
MRSLLITAVAATAVIALTPLSPASAATRADIGSVSCQGGSLNVQFNPAVTFKRETVQTQASGDLGTCTSTMYPKITGGTVRIVGSGIGACPGPFSVGYGKAQISWNDGTTTVIPQMRFHLDGLSASFEGPVNEGRFKGGFAHANGQTTTSLIDIGTQCVNGGLTNYATTIDQLTIADI